MRWLYEAHNEPPPFEAAAAERSPQMWAPPMSRPQFPGSPKKGSKPKKWKKKEGLYPHLTIPLAGLDPPTGPGGSPPLYEGIHFPWYPYWQEMPPERMPLRPIEMEQPPLQTRPSFKWDWETTKNLVLPQENLWRFETYSGIEFQTAFGEDVNLDKWLVYWKMPDEPQRLPVFNQQDHEFDLTQSELITLDKWVSQVTMPQAKLPVIQVQQWDDLRELAVVIEQITVDKWHHPFRAKFERSPWIVPRSGVIDPEPLPDDDLTAYAIWHPPIQPPIEMREALRPIVAGVLLPEARLETISVSALGQMGLPTRPRPWLPDVMPRHWHQPLETEGITLDKWYSPLGFEFRTRAVPLLPTATELVPSGDVEAITVDKWWTDLAQPLIVLPPVIHPTSLMDPNPIPPVPGYDEYWEGSVPVVYQGPVLPTLYVALDDLNYPDLAERFRWPVRRKNRD